jgi:hypothetical protein
VGGSLSHAESISLAGIIGALVIGSALLVIDGRLFNFILSVASTPTASR